MSTEVGSIVAKLALDVKTFSSGVQQAIDEIGQIGQALQSALGSFSSQGLSAIMRQVAEVSEGIKKLQGELSTLQSELNLDTENLSFRGLVNDSANLRESVNGVTTSVKQSQESFAAMSSSVRNVSTDIKKISNETKKASKNTDKLTTGAKNTRSQFEKTAQSVSSLGKDLQRIAGGILISQSFYKLLNVVEGLVSGSVEFMHNMEQAAIAFKYLLGSEQAASSFIEAMQQFAVTSPLDTSATMQATRQLMAMGFAAQEVIPTMRVLADTASVFTSDVGGMNDMISRITVAIGQMRSAGKVMGQELRQLYNAGIPVFSILQEELGLTADEIRNIGHLSLDANTAISALLRGLNKRYAGAAEAYTKTIPGAIDQIKDSFYILFSLMMQMPYKYVAAGFQYISAAIQALATITKLYGVGGLFEALIPKDLQMPIRNIIGSIMELGKAFMWIGMIVKTVFGDAIAIIINLLGLLLPPVTQLIHILAQVAYWVYMNVPLVRQLLAAMAAYSIIFGLIKSFMWLWKVLKLGAVVGWVTKQFIALWTTMKNLWVFLMANKWAIPLVALLALLIAVIATSEKARAAIMRFWNALMGKNKVTSESLDIGFDPNDIAMPSFKEPETEASDFENKLGDIGDAFGDVGDAADDAGKKIKKSFNQSFDEIYTINENDDMLGLGSLAELDLSFLADSLGDINGILDDTNWTGLFDQDWGSLVGDMNSLLGDFGEFGDLSLPDFDLGEWTGNFWDNLIEAFSAPEWVGAGIGAGIGALIGGLIAGPAGAKIGAAIGGVIGWIVGLFWDDIKEAFNLSDAHGIDIAMGTGLGAIIGSVIGGPAGAAIGAAIGGLVSAVSALLFGKLAEVFNKGEKDLANSGVGQGIGTAIGAIIGGILGGPAGAAIGAAIGGLVGGIIGLFWSDLEKGFNKIVELNKISYGVLLQFLEGTKEALKDWISGNGDAFSNFWETLTQDFVSWTETTSVGFTTWIETTRDGLLSWINSVNTGFTDWSTNSTNALVAWWTTTEQGFTSWWNNTQQGFASWQSTVAEGIANWSNMSISEFAQWTSTTFNEFAQWTSSTVSEFASWAATSSGAFGQWILDTTNGFTSWVRDSLQGFTDWVSQSSNGFKQWIQDTRTGFQTWIQDVKSALSAWAQQILSIFRELWEHAPQGFRTLWEGILSSVRNWSRELVDAIRNTVRDAMNALRELFNMQRQMQSSSTGLSGLSSFSAMSTPNIAPRNFSTRSNPGYDMPIGQGHATGGIFSRAHLAPVSENNKQEAIIPLDNYQAMRPFVDAVAERLGILAQNQGTTVVENGNDDLPPIYVGTLIADERGLRELYRKFKVIEAKESARFESPDSNTTETTNTIILRR